jgi:hypothetical protein
MVLLISVFGIFLQVLGILELNNLKQWPIAIFIMALTIILLVTFYWWQKKRIRKELNPLLDINLFKNRVISIGTMKKIQPSKTTRNWIINRLFVLVKKNFGGKKSEIF